MSLAFVVLSYNHPLHTARAVHSALKMGLPVWLVHNGSLPKHVDFLRQEFKGTNLIRHLVLPENKGYSGGVNEGLQACFQKHEWAIFLTNDCEFINLPKIPYQPAAVIPQIYRRSLEQVDSVGGLFYSSLGKLVHCKTSKEFFDAGDEVTRYIPGSAFMVHRTVFEKTCGMNERLGTYWDDVDWSIRIQDSGFQLQVQENWNVLHHVGKTCQKKSLYSIYYFQRNRKRISWKYSKPSERPKLVYHLAKDWARLSLQLVKKKRFSDLSLLQKAVTD